MEKSQNRTLLFYGAGEYAAMIYRHAKRKCELYGEPVAFIDRDIYKQGHDLFGIPIISWENAQKQYGEDFYIYVTAHERVAPQILAFLQGEEVKPERILNNEPIVERKGCAFAETNLNVRPMGSNINYGNCTVLDNLVYSSTANHLSVDHRLASDQNVIQEVLKYINTEAQKIVEGCVEGHFPNCINMQEQYFFKDRKLRVIIFSGFGACNLKCSYCHHNHSDFDNAALSFDQYAVFANILKELQKESLITKDTVIKIASGEFSISESGNRFAELAGDYPVEFLTNAYLYSPQAAKSIETSGLILCSVDAGTSERFKRIKGVDGFNRVSENLQQYSKHGAVALKYILLDGINDTWEDLEGFCRLADEVAVRVDLTRNYMDASTRLSDHAIEFAARFIRYFRNAGKMNLNMSFIRSGEGERLNKILERLEHDGK